MKIERKMAIQGHVFWGQWKGDKGLILYNNVGLIFYEDVASEIDVFDYQTRSLVIKNVDFGRYV